MFNTPIYYKFKKLFKVDNERSNNVLKNIIISFGVKGGSIVVGFIMVPLTMDYISPSKYGLWLTISSIVTWMSFLDIGMGNGLRNVLTSSLARNEKEMAKVYISTTYAALSIVSLCLLLFFLIFIPSIDWRTVLNIDSNINEDIQLIILIVFCSFCTQFIVQLINTVLTAVHKPAIVSFITFLGQLGVLITIIILKATVPGTLDILVWALTFVPIIVMLIASFYYYRTKLIDIAPSFNAVKLKYTKSILNIGASFFIIQIGALALFQTNNFIIMRVVGAEAVTEFNIAYKLFSIITLIFIIVITPYWSAFTDAYEKDDFKWMTSANVKLRKYFYKLSLLALILLVSSPIIYDFWIGKSVVINPLLSFSMMLYVVVHMWLTLHTYILNGTGKVRLQLFTIILAAFINIPLAIYLGQIWGLVGIVASNTLVCLVLGLMYYIQVEKTLSKTALGMWAK